jgi:O-antigen ligase
MINHSAQVILGRILTFGVLIVTLFLEVWKSSEPINAPKMLVLSAFGISALFVIATSWEKSFWVTYRKPIIALSSFYALCLASVFFSEDNVLVGIFGIKGRSTGLITYLSLAVLFLAAVLVQSVKHYDSIVKILLFAGAINIFYNQLFIFGLDPIPWSNPYGTILGTFGNPNFISSFLGIIFAVLVSVILSNSISTIFRLLSVGLIPVVLYQILYSNSIQGLFVAGVGTATALYIFIRVKLKSKILSISYVSVVLVIGFVSILGMLQKGPLASLIYKTSVSLRGEYWAAGINMGMSNPLTGVGLDSYGNWFRLYRRASALVLPGPSVVSDSAHNVFIDFFASGGFPLFIAYVSIQVLVVIAILRILKSLDNFALTPVALIAAWIGYTSQSIISINQIGLAVWGWVLGGAIIGYSMLGSHSIVVQPKKSKSQNVKKSGRSEAAVSLASIFGLLVGFLIALPPVRTDIAWRSAMREANLGAIENAMRMWPQNHRTLNSGIVLFANNGLQEKAIEYARLDVEMYKENFVSWYTLFQLQSSTDQEKRTALNKMIELDPRNEELKRLLALAGPNQ